MNYVLTANHYLQIGFHIAKDKFCAATVFTVSKTCAIADSIFQASNITRNIEKFYDCSGYKRVKQFIKLNDSFRTVCDNTSLILGTASLVQVCTKLHNSINTIANIANITSNIIGTVGGVLSVFSIFLNASNAYKTYKFLKEYNIAVRTTENPSIDLQFGNLKKFILESKEGHLKRQFRTDGAALKVRITQLNDTATSEEKTELIQKLRGRIKGTFVRHNVAILADVINITATGILLTGIATPIGLGLNFGVIAMYLGIFAESKISNYRFETEMGLIARTQTDPFNPESNIQIKLCHRVKDFGKWLFCSTNYIKQAPAS